MSRLTKDLRTPHDDTTYSDVVKDAVDREDIVLTILKHYEDLEEELGCPLDVVFKAIKNGIHIKIDDEEDDIAGWKLSIFMEEQCFVINEMLFRTKLPFADHGKTWWLKGDKQ